MTLHLLIGVGFMLWLGISGIAMATFLRTESENQNDGGWEFSPEEFDD
ncbi:MAG: hypothetical protein ABEI06_01395 [Halobacteriaceae archaeon]